MIAGVMQPKSNSAFRRKNQGKRQEAANYLAGVKADMHHVEAYLQKSKTFEVFNTLQNTQRLKVEQVIEEMNLLLKSYPKSQMVGVYYSGHGCANGGDWCFKDGNFGFKLLRNVLLRRGNIKIFCDSCFSGDWAVELKKWEGLTQNVYIFAGSVPGKSALDAGAEGGMATVQWLNLFPKLFDHEANSFGEVMKAMQDSYGCCAKIDGKKTYHYLEFRDAEAEYDLAQSMKSISLADKDVESDDDGDDHKAQAQASSGVTCSKGHPLRMMTQAQLVAEKPGYEQGVQCDGCGRSATKVGGSAHCSRCEYDLCPRCYIEQSAQESGSSYKAAKVKKTCDKGHPLYKLSLSELYEYSDYPRGTYICNDCFQMSSPAKGYAYAHHCPLCRFDLCPQCVSK